MQLSEWGATVQDMNPIDHLLTDTVKSVPLPGGTLLLAQPGWSELDWQHTVYGLGLADRAVNDQDMGMLSSGHLFWWVPNE